MKYITAAIFLITAAVLFAAMVGCENNPTSSVPVTDTGNDAIKNKGDNRVRVYVDENLSIVKCTKFDPASGSWVELETVPDNALNSVQNFRDRNNNIVEMIRNGKNMNNGMALGDTTQPSDSGGGGGGPGPGFPMANRSWFVPDKREPVWGHKNADVGMVFYFDYQCPFSARSYLNDIPVILEKYASRGLNFTMVNFPMTMIPSHDYAFMAAMAGEIVHKFRHGNFWQFSANIFMNWYNLDKGTITIYADNAGISNKKFWSWMDRRIIKDEVKSDINFGYNIVPERFITPDGTIIEIIGIPTFFVYNDVTGVFVKIIGAQSLDVFIEVVEFVGGQQLNSTDGDKSIEPTDGPIELETGIEIMPTWSNN